MEITRLRFRDFRNQTALAAVEIVFDGVFIIRDVIIRNGRGGVYITYPKKKYPDGTLGDLAHPTNKEFSDYVLGVVLESFRRYEASGEMEQFIPPRNMSSTPSK